jgi:ribosomal protein L10
LTVGVTTAPGVCTPAAFALHVYDAAPLAVSVAVWPAHTAVGVAVTVSVGELVIATETVCVLVQVPLAPVTVYVVFTVGATVAEDAVTLPALALHV